jgi:hypothetical protein
VALEQSPRFVIFGGDQPQGCVPAPIHGEVAVSGPEGQGWYARVPDSHTRWLSRRTLMNIRIFLAHARRSRQGYLVGLMGSL